MGFLSWLPDVLRSAGVDVYVMPGAETRTTRASGLTPQGVVWHHTATGPNWADGHVAALLRDGRQDLDGPLSQVGIERDGTWVIVALGRASHNGYGHWGNDSIGLEFYNSGLGEPWSDAQVDSGIRGTRAILAHLDMRAATHVLGHRETDPKRKIDPAGLDMGDIRRRITNHQEDTMNSAQEDKLDRVLASLTRVENEHFPHLGGRTTAVDQYGQEGERSDLWRWSAEAVVILRDLKATEIADAVVTRLGKSADAAVIKQAVIDGLTETLGSLDD